MSDSTSRAHDGLVLVGRVVKPHGIRGELCVESYADSPSLFPQLESVLLGSGSKKPTRFGVASVRPHQGRMLLTLEGVADRTRAESLRGLDVFVPESTLPELDEDEFYLHDLLGLDVLQEDGTCLGVLEHFIEAGGQLTWAILHESGREILLPGVPEFILDVDIDAGKVVVAPPEGLVDLYLKPE
ncbi:MAG: ribosome maturation factor RimM [Desulfovibrionaceae bacterium]